VVEKEPVPTSSSWWPTFVKVILWILWIVIFAFFWAISAFAIKAKLRERDENEED
jgi:phosphotransferase system  glucose/maltose/N-acetylglucosamine-specific IIC component